MCCWFSGSPDACSSPSVCFFFFNDTATTEIYTLSLHDALPISVEPLCRPNDHWSADQHSSGQDRKSTRLNSSHSQISYAVFCLKKKKKHLIHLRIFHDNV